MITKGENQNRVAQVVDYLYDKSAFAIMINYNGYIRFVSSDKIRLATSEEKKKDKKQHNRELQLTRDQKSYLNELIYKIKL
tara:strand:+ start:3543 stop:3785 length:243 start_codon:yes stop_codon:yes gene_type:complete